MDVEVTERDFPVQRAWVMKSSVYVAPSAILVVGYFWLFGYARIEPRDLGELRIWVLGVALLALVSPFIARAQRAAFHFSVGEDFV